MFNSKSPLVKVVLYGIMGFFSLIIIISFGMPDFISRMGLDQSVMATVNGEKVNRIDYLRFRDRNFGSGADAKMEDMILNYFISNVLLLQEARKAGFSVSTVRVNDTIRTVTGLRDDDPNRTERFRAMLQQNRMSLTELIRMMESDMIRQDYIRAVQMGIAVPSDEIVKEAQCRDSRVQIRYAYASTMDLKKKYAAAIAVTDDEVSAELKKNPAEVKDPKTDRKRIHDKLEEQKLQKARKDLIARIDAIAFRKGGSFDEASALLGGVVSTTEPFKIGELPRDPAGAGRNLADLASAKVFMEECLTIQQQATSRAIITASGIFIFTPTMKDIKLTPNLEKEGPQLTAQLEKELLQNAERNLMQKIQEKSRIIKNLRPREAE